MRILFIGDIIGKPGRAVVSQLLPSLKKEFNPDIVLANGENLAGGFGLTPEVVAETYEAGVNVLTTGNHVWDKKEVMKIIDSEPRLVRPANYPPGVPGRGSVVVDTASGTKVGIINLNGRVFLPPLDCPFRRGDEEIKSIRQQTQVIIVDFHAEATSEKVAFGWYIDGLVTAVIGTHTHVQTADERILPNGTAYITDAGMTGSFDSVIGMVKDTALNRFFLMMPMQFKPATGSLALNAVIVDADPVTGHAQNIQRIVRCVC